MSPRPRKSPLLSCSHCVGTGAIPAPKHALNWSKDAKARLAIETTSRLQENRKESSHNLYKMGLLDLSVAWANQHGVELDRIIGGERFPGQRARRIRHAFYAWLRDEHGFSTRDISYVLNVPKSTVIDSLQRHDKEQAT